MSGDDVSVVLAHGAWADGSSWSKVIVALQQKGVTTIAAPLPLTSLSDDVLALDRASERVEGQLVLVGHAYAGAVIGSTRNQRVKSLVYVAGLAPAEGETVADVFYRATPHPQAPKLAPDNHGLIWLPSDAFATAFAQDATKEERRRPPTLRHSSSISICRSGFLRYFNLRSRCCSQVCTCSRSATNHSKPFRAACRRRDRPRICGLHGQR